MIGKCKGTSITVLYSTTSGNCSYSSAVRHRLRQTCRLSMQTQPCSRTAKQPHAQSQPAVQMMVSTPVIHVITWITTHLLTQKGWKAELAWLVDP